MSCFTASFYDEHKALKARVEKKILYSLDTLLCMATLQSNHQCDSFISNFPVLASP